MALVDPWSGTKTALNRQLAFQEKRNEQARRAPLEALALDSMKRKGRIEEMQMAGVEQDFKDNQAYRKLNTDMSPDISPLDRTNKSREFFEQRGNYDQAEKIGSYQQSKREESEKRIGKLYEMFLMGGGGEKGREFAKQYIRSTVPLEQQEKELQNFENLQFDEDGITIDTGDGNTVQVMLEPGTGKLKPIKGGSSGGSGNVSLSPAAIKVHATNLRKTGKMVSLGRGKDAAATRMAIADEAAKQVNDLGQDGSNMVKVQIEIKALQKTAEKIQQRASSMSAFTNNMKQQNEELKKVAAKLDRLGFRAGNAPINYLTEKFKGDATWGQYIVLIEELSNEAARVAQNATESVAQLSEGAREKWAEMHPKNMPINDLLQLMDQTVRMGQYRQKSWDNELEMTYRAIDGIDDKYKKKAEKAEKYSVGSVYKGKTITRTGWDGDKRVVLLDDGSTAYPE